jgi:hypothetical protein
MVVTSEPFRGDCIGSSSSTLQCSAVCMCGIRISELVFGWSEGKLRSGGRYKISDSDGGSGRFRDARRAGEFDGSPALAAVRTKGIYYVNECRR